MSLFAITVEWFPNFHALSCSLEHHIVNDFRIIPFNTFVQITLYYNILTEIDMIFKMHKNVTLVVGLVLIFMTLSSSTRRNLIDSTEKRLLVRRIRKLPINTYKPTNSYSTGESELKTKNLGHMRHETIRDLDISNTTISHIENDLEVSDSLNNTDRVRLEKMLQGKLREL